MVKTFDISNLDYVSNRIYSLKYQRSTTLGVAKIKYLKNVLLLLNKNKKLSNFSIIFFNKKDLYIFSQVNDLQTHLASERGRASSGAQALSESKSRIENLVHKVSELESSNLKLNQKISDLAQTLEDQNSAQRSQVHSVVTAEAYTRGGL